MRVRTVLPRRFMGLPAVKRSWRIWPLRRIWYPLGSRILHEGRILHVNPTSARGHGRQDVPTRLERLAVLRVGLSGGIGSGESEVARRLAEHGAVLIDADVAAREVVVPGSPGLAQIAKVFVESVLRPDGSLNRERLGQIVFGDPG